MDMMERGILERRNNVPSYAKGLRVLVVDHDTTSLLYLASMLEQYSYEVTTTELTSVALSMIRENKDRFKLALVNVDKLDMDSNLFLRTLIKKNLAVILVASERSLSMVVKAIAEGASIFLEKPVCQEDLKYAWEYAYQNEINTRKKNQEGAGENLNYGIQDVPSNDVAYVLDDLNSSNHHNQQHGNRVTAESQNTSEIHDELMKFLSSESQDQVCPGSKRKRSDTNNKNKKCTTTRSSSWNQTNKPPRMSWTPELNLKFEAAFAALGEKNARPKTILQLMNVPNLTPRQVASHLQKHKIQMKQLLKKKEKNASVEAEKIPNVYGEIHTSSEFQLGYEETLNQIFQQLGYKSFGFPDAGKSQEAEFLPGKCASESSINVQGQKTTSPAEVTADDINQQVNNFVSASFPPAAIPVPPHFLPNDDPMKLADAEQEMGSNGLDSSEPLSEEFDQFCEWLAKSLFEENSHP